MTGAFKGQQKQVKGTLTNKDSLTVTQIVGTWKLQFL